MKRLAVLFLLIALAIALNQLALSPLTGIRLALNSKAFQIIVYRNGAVDSFGWDYQLPKWRRIHSDFLEETETKD